MPTRTAPWIPAFDECLAAGELEGAITILDTLATGHAGTAPQAVKDAAVARIRRTLGAHSERTGEIGLALAMAENATAREIGISLPPPFYGSAPVEVDQRLLHTGDDPNWEVREWAASALAHVVSGHFELVVPRLRDWAAHPSPIVRRMVAVASGSAMRDCTPAHCEELLDLLTPLMADRDPYVGKNLGAFALGSYAIRYRPDLVARWVDTQDLGDERTAWNLAMMFTTSEGAKHADRFPAVLARLAEDERKSVRTALGKASANLAKRNSPALKFLERSGDV